MDNLEFNDSEFDDFGLDANLEDDIDLDDEPEEEIDLDDEFDDNIFNKEESIDSSFIDNNTDDEAEDEVIDMDSDPMATVHDEPGPEVDEIDTGIQDGALVDNIDLHDDEDEPVPTRESDFINDSGNIVVQDASDDRENGFNLQYVDIDKIAITHRIRKMQSVEGLVQSIQSTGLLQPLTVAPTLTEGLYVLLDGYKRIIACAKAGKTRVPCIINTKVSTPEIPILEAMYNHSSKYSIKEQIDYINYLETEKGIMNPAMIEYLLQMNSGDYTKLKDILNDNDDDIVSKLYEGVYDIATAFRKLEQRRKKESAEEKENKKAARVYEDAESSGVNQIEGSGEEADGSGLTDEQIKSLAINPETLDEDIENTSLNDMIEEDKGMEGFEPHKQKVGEREYIDPILKKSAMARDKNTCQCCKRGGEQYIDILDAHHILPVFLGGKDNIDNIIMLCVACHRLVHLYSTDDLHIDKALLNSSYDELSEDQKSRYDNEEIFEDEKQRFKRIVALGSTIRKGVVAKGMNKEQYKKEHPNTGIGRRKPGVKGEQEIM